MVDYVKCIDRESLFVYFAAFAVNLMTGTAGMGYAWASPVLPKLNTNDTSENPIGRPLTLIEESWIVSLQSLGAMSGPLFTGTISSKIGQKRTILVYSQFFLISSIILLFANQIFHFYIARFLLGIGSGCVMSLIPIYVGEISDVSNRGATSCFLVTLLNGFLLIVYIIGPYVSIRTLAISSLVNILLFMFLFGVFVPESPYFLVYKGKISQSKQVLKKLRPSNAIDKNLEEIIQVVNSTEKFASLKDLFKSKLIRKCLFIGVGLNVFQQSNGMLAIFSYMQLIFEKAHTSIPPNLSVVLIGSILLIINLIMIKVVSHVKRKTLLLISYIGMFIIQFFLGMYFFIQEKGYNLDFISWIPVVCIAIYTIAYSIGAGPVTFTLIGEIFPLNVKSYLSSFSAFAQVVTGFLISILYPYLSNYLGISWAFWIFDLSVVFAIIFIIVIVPETKDSTFLEIQTMLEK